MTIFGEARLPQKDVLRSQYRVLTSLPGLLRSRTAFIPLYLWRG